MKNRRLSAVGIIFTTIFCLLFLTQCELFLGDEGNANVGIDLSDLYGGTGRAITSPPPGISITRVRVSVFASDMQRIEKWVSAGARFVNMYVPTGRDRYFTLEVFFSFDQQSTFAYSDLRSFKGRAKVDLRPGMLVGLKFRMVSGATTLLVPDYTNRFVYQSDILDFTTYGQGIAGFDGTTFTPNDIDYDAAGRIFVSNSTNITYADTFNSTVQTKSSLATATAIAIDRDCNINISPTGGPNATAILYAANGGNLFFTAVDDATPNQTTPLNPGPLTPMTSPFVPPITGGAINGLAVDPWTHYLYIVGSSRDGLGQPIQFITQYNPFLKTGNTFGVVMPSRTNTDFPFFRSLRDVIVKDDGIFVLNQVGEGDTQLPIVLKFDRNLNFIQGFGSISSQLVMGQSNLIPSIAPGKFYHPKRFFAQENDGLYIMDDSSLKIGGRDVNKLIFINTNLDPASWSTYPFAQDAVSGAGEIFTFFEP